MKVSAHTEYGKLVSILLKHPLYAFIDEENLENQWRQLNYVEKPDLEQAKEEFVYFKKLLDTVNPEILYLDNSIGTGLDSIYTRDASIATNKGMVICNMGKETRAGEPQSHKLAFEYAGLEILGAIHPPGRVEGGDVAWVDENTLIVGRGYRTNDDGIRQLRNLLSGFADVVEVHLPHYKGPSDVFHLMSIFSPVDKDLAVIYSPLMTVHFREMLASMNYEFVEVPEEEFNSMGCNVLAISPRNCLIVEGNPVTKQKLEDVGVTVREYSGREISIKGCGGPTCLTRPILREL